MIVNDDDIVNLDDLGVDINSNWEFKDGDLKIVSDKENLAQAITNRLNTLLGALDYFYINYGAGLGRFLGWRRNETTLKFIELEVENCLKQDPRLQNITLALNYGEKGVVNIYIRVTFDEEDELELNYILNEDGSVEEVNDGS